MFTLTRAAIAAALFLSFPLATAQPVKDLPAEAAQLIALLKAGAEATVADIGAGGGEMTVEVARQLGRKARVYSTDINPKTVEALKRKVSDAGLDNVVVLEGHANRTNLPDACCDAIFVRHVYHHFGDPAAMNASLYRSLKPGGRFAVMDFPPDKPVKGTVPPAQRGSGDTHGVTADTVIEELKAAGFEILETRPEWPGGLFLVLARKGS